MLQEFPAQLKHIVSPLVGHQKGQKPVVWPWSISGNPQTFKGHKTVYLQEYHFPQTLSGQGWSVAGLAARCPLCLALKSPSWADAFCLGLPFVDFG